LRQEWAANGFKGLSCSALPDGSLEIVMRGVKEDPSDPTV
jgi:hypothetical protein